MATLGRSSRGATRAGLAAVGLGLVLVLALGAGSCAAEAEDPPLDRLELPTGLALSPAGRWLLVTNGNWDRSRLGSSLVTLDLDALEQSMASAPSSSCRSARADGASSLRCEAADFIDAGRGLRLPSGAGNIAVDEDGAPGGSARLLIPTRIFPSVGWIDVLGEGDTLSLRCGQDSRAYCDLDHLVPDLPEDPGRLSLDEQGFAFAYLPHLVDRRLSLLSLDAERGPVVVDVEQQFFRSEDESGNLLGGGLAVAQRACDLESGNAPADSQDCARPYLVASQRFWLGLRPFRVATGLDAILPGVEVRIDSPAATLAVDEPVLGDLGFEDPDQGERLLVVSTTPPMLLRFDTSLDEDGDPRFDLVDSVGLCRNPNVLSVHRPAPGEPGAALALVSCYADDQIAAVDLLTFTVVASVPVGEGPNELLIDEQRRWLYVANTAGSSISIVELDASSTDYLRVLAELR